MPKACFITFEGTDGVGKSTQIRFVQEYLEQRGIDVVLTREPGGCSISEQIRQVLLSKENAEMCPECEALLYAAARAQHMKEVILPAIESGKTVICDRFYDSSMAYQGWGRNLGAETVERINETALFGKLPDLTVLLALPPAAAFERKRGEHDDRMEESGDAFFERAYEGFCQMAQRYPERVRSVDAHGSIEEIRLMIQKLIDELYGWTREA